MHTYSPAPLPGSCPKPTSSSTPPSPTRSSTRSPALSVEQLVQSLCDTKQGYTQFAGVRPFGVSFLFAGWDKTHGFQLYMSDPSGNYSGWKDSVVGANSQAAQSMLKQGYRDRMNREEAVALALKVLSKTMDSTSLTAEKLELAEVFLHPGTGEVQYQLCSPDAMGKLLAKAGLSSRHPMHDQLSWFAVILGSGEYYPCDGEQIDELSWFAVCSRFGLVLSMRW